MTQETTGASSEFEERFFKDTTTVAVEISILNDTYQDMLRLIADKQWDTAEGMQSLLLSGYGYELGSLSLHADSEAQEEIARRLAELEAVAAVMRFQTYAYLKGNQTLNMHVVALERQNAGLMGLVERLRSEITTLQCENEELRRHAGSPPPADRHDTVPDEPPSVAGQPPADSASSGRWSGLLSRVLRR